MQRVRVSSSLPSPRRSNGAAEARLFGERSASDRAKAKLFRASPTSRYRPSSAFQPLGQCVLSLSDAADVIL